MGRDTAANFVAAAQIAAKMRSIPGAVDVHIQQQFDQPRLQFDLDRVRAQQVWANRPRRLQQSSRLTQFELSDHTESLAQSEEWCLLQHRSADTKV